MRHLYYRTIRLGRLCGCGSIVPWPSSSVSAFRNRPGRLFSTQMIGQPKTKDGKWDVKRIRNIGIIAHIDAGKTTTTERMLYYCGYTHALGDVDSGSTVTDYMEQERERGITITSAAVTFYYNNHRLNLIDTPGHVDFTLEVERSLRVLDGAVTILDASAGVEAQTVTVWRQAHRFRIPSIVYLNKMDKPAANVDLCIRSIKEKLKVEPIMLHKPLGEGKSFRGMVDLVRMELLEWPDDGDGKEYKRSPVTPSSPHSEEFHSARRHVIDTIAEHDDQLADRILTSGDDPYTSISSLELNTALRRCTLSRRLVPTLCGASFRNKGVQPLMDSVCDYLPNPDERKHVFTKFYGKGELCGLVFKIIHDQHHGPLTFIRVYNGRLVSGMKVYNANRECVEMVNKVYEPCSDEVEEVKAVYAGNIAVVPNLKFTFTGDTILESKEVAKRAVQVYETRNVGGNRDTTSATDPSDDTLINEIDTRSKDKLVLAGIKTPEPVFFCSIESPSYGKQQAFEQALQQLSREDPSLRFREDAESGQTIMEGMGQLHIEIVKDRLLKEYDLDVFLGPLQINYRETIFNSGEAFHTLKDTVIKEQTKKETYEVTIALRVEPTVPGSGPLKKLRLRHVVGENYLLTLPEQYMEAAYRGCVHALGYGPLLGRPVQDVDVILLEMATNRRCPATLVGACANVCLKEALKNAGCHVIEPMVYLETTVPEDYYTVINGELLRRRAEILETSGKLEDRSRTICATVPLAKMIDFSAVLRRLTSGSGVMHMEVKEYAVVPPLEVENIVKEVTGFRYRQ